MENLIFGVTIKKKQLSSIFPSADTTKTGGAWNSEFKRLQTLGDVEKVEGTRGYVVHSVYDEPKELLHGNKGKEAWNKDALDTTTIKYQLALAMIQLNCGEQTKSGFLKVLGLNSKNMEHFHTKFKTEKYNMLNLVDKFAFGEVIGIQTALSRFILGAIEIIKNGEFPNVSIHEILWVNVNGKFTVAEDYEMYLPLYKKARQIAEKAVDEKFGKNLFFVRKMKLITKQYEEIIAEDVRFEELKLAGIKFFYTKYLIENKNKVEATPLYDENGDLIVERWEIEKNVLTFTKKFIGHRLDNADKNIAKLIKNNPELAGGFSSKGDIEKFAKSFVPFVLENDNFKAFVMKYDLMATEIKTNYNSAIEALVEDALGDLFG